MPCPIRGEVDGWAYLGDKLFIEMRFIATIMGKRVEWHDIDKFTFEDGVAVERHAYFDPMPIIKAYMRKPLGWLRLFPRMRRR